MARPVRPQCGGTGARALTIKDMVSRVLIEACLLFSALLVYGDKSHSIQSVDQCVTGLKPHTARIVWFKRTFNLPSRREMMEQAHTVRRPAENAQRVRAVQYVRMSTDHQSYSIDNQKDAIREFADAMNYDIVATYEDAGRNGLNLEGRAGLQRLLADVETKNADFESSSSTT
ncbi:recombinase family protein [Mesorhizobium sp. WSM1497]|uniref:recombinase family protein n=1 Tax=Mesorhizobium sp. WSM1497 TaxID=278153 RepID=UPI0032AF468C